MIMEVSTVEQLTAALDAATGGETILLAPGDYGRFVYFGDEADWDAAGVTIRSEDPGNPAVFTDKFDMRSVSDLTISDVTFDADSLGDSANAYWVGFSKSSNVTLENIVQRGHLATAEEGFDPYDPAIESFRDPIEGFPRAGGLRVAQTDGFTLRNSDIAEVRVAISLIKSSDVVIENTDIHDVREGLFFTDIDGLEITGNTFRDFRPWLDTSDPAYDPVTHEHPDMIQYWAANATEGIRDVTIADNVFEMPQGSGTQSIFGHMKNPAPGVTAENFAILNNLILNGHPNAIRIGDVEGGLIAGNLLLPNGTDVENSRTPKLLLTGESENFHVVNNAAVSFFGADTLGPRDPGGLAAQNITIENFRVLSFDPADPDYWGNVDVAALLAALRTDPSQLGITVSGTGDDDLLRGLGGDDKILLRSGSDTATGGYGADRFTIDWAGRGAADAHRITDLDFDEGDQLVINGFGGGNVRITSQAALAEFVARPGVTLTDDTLTLSDGSGPDLSLTLGGVEIEDGAVSPVVPGVSTIGGKGADVLIGTASDDKILMRQDEDIATGGAGADQFILDWRFHSDGDSHTITDFDMAGGDYLLLRNFTGKHIVVRDQADLDALIARDDVSAVERTDALTLRFTDSDGMEISLHLDGQGSGNATSTLPIKLTGTDADDVFTGAAGADAFLFRFGNDTATGGAGPDTFIIDARFTREGDAHRIADLDFAEGDTLLLRFFDSTPITVDSAEDLAALDDRPDMALASSDGLRLLTLTDLGGDMFTLGL
ncbi:MAG: right-handed parallel beta-helix repeat-containing protein [Alphaproteobacteria bacterium]|nr:right-handed parallel beta-helix repeat-containing protein [Alphaproteobacteria bacterium]